MKVNQTLKSFKYGYLGTMATVGQHLAVVELPGFRFQDIFGWFVWMFIHLMSIIGVKTSFRSSLTGHGNILHTTNPPD